MFPDQKEALNARRLRPPITLGRNVMTLFPFRASWGGWWGAASAGGMAGHWMVPFLQSVTCREGVVFTSARQRSGTADWRRGYKAKGYSRLVLHRALRFPCFVRLYNWKELTRLQLLVWFRRPRLPNYILETRTVPPRDPDARGKSRTVVHSEFIDIRQDERRDARFETSEEADCVLRW